MGRRRAWKLASFVLFGVPVAVLCLALFAAWALAQVLAAGLDLLLDRVIAWLQK